MRNDLYGEKIDELFATVLQISCDCLTDKTRPGDPEQWDSLKHMILVSAFEEEFNVSVEPEDVFEMYKDYKTFKTTILKKLE